MIGNEGKVMDETRLFKDGFNQIGKLWRRALAYLADGLILVAPFIIISFIYLLVILKGNFSNLSQELTPETLLPPEIVSWLIAILYFTYFIGKTGQTPGKKSMNLKVVNLNGAPIGYGKAFLRCLFFAIYGFGYIGLSLFVISVILAITDKQKRTLHDRVVKSFVIGKQVEEAIEKVIQEGKPRISGSAIFAFFLSIFCFFVPVVGPLICFYVCGRVLYDIKQSKGLLKGKSLAIAGIVISVLWLILFVIVIMPGRPLPFLPF